MENPKMKQRVWSKTVMRTGIWMRFIKLIKGQNLGGKRYPVSDV